MTTVRRTLSSLAFPSNAASPSAAAGPSSAQSLAAAVSGDVFLPTAPARPTAFQDLKPSMQVNVDESSRRDRISVDLDMMSRRGTSLEYVDTPEGRFATVSLPGGAVSREKGFPEVPLLKVNLQTPLNENYDVVVRNVEYEELPYEGEWLPSKGLLTHNQDPAKVKHEVAPESRQDVFFPGNGSFVQRGSHFLLRGVRGYELEIAPVQVNTATKTVRILKNIEFDLVARNDGKAPVAARAPDQASILREHQGLFEAVFSNFRWDGEIKDGKGDLLVVHTARDKDALAPLIEHKKSLGFNVKTVEVPPGTQVRQLIKDEYTKNPDLLYVLNVGDWQDIKCETNSTRSPEDNELGMVSGDDTFVDIAIGRLSANNAEQVKAMVAKTIAYEKSALMPWHARALGIASAEGAGYGDDKESDGVHQTVLFENKLKPAGFTELTKAFDPRASKDTIARAVNDGVGIINYTGHGSETAWSTSGFSNRDVAALRNGEKTPIIFSVACVNGAYHNAADSFAEAWTRKADGGAVAALMATINQPWVDPMIGQDYITDMLVGGYDYAAGPGDGISTDHGKKHLGSAVFNGLALMRAEVKSSSMDDTIKTWTLFGDPTLEMKVPTRPGT